MRVLLVHNRYRSASPGGEDRVVDQELAALSGAGHTVERFERCNDEIAGRSLVGRALVPAEVVWSETSRRGLTATLRAVRPDVVHVHNTFPLLSPSVLYACRAQRVPVVMTVHNYRLVCSSGILFRDGAICHDCVGRFPLPAVRHGCYRGSRLATVPLAAGMTAHRRAWRTLVSAYVCPSRSLRDIIVADGLPASRLFVKPHFVPHVPAPEAAPRGFVLYAGRLAPVKGVDLLMDAWDRYASTAQRGRLRLLVAGAGPLQNRLAAWTRGRSDAEWVGLVGPSECTSLQSRAHAVIVPSAWEEAFGLVVVEAMARGVPAVAPAHGSFPELITDGHDGVLFAPGDAAGLARVLEDVARRPEHYRALGRAARHTYEERFSPQANMEHLLSIYRFAIEHPAA